MALLDARLHALLSRLHHAGVLRHDQPRPSDLLPALGLPLALAGYLVLRGWLNALLVLLCLAGVWQLFRQRAELRQLLQRAPVRWLLAALVSPFLAVVLSQAAHQEWVPRAFDSPLRLLLSAVLLLWLLLRRVNLLPLVAWALPLAVWLCAASIFLNPHAARYFWEGRFATYFIDPLTLGQHITILGFMALFCVGAQRAAGLGLSWLQWGAVPVALAVSLGTQSRSAWVIVPVLALLWIVGVKRHNSLLKIGLALVAVVAVCWLAYAGSATVQMRVDLALTEYRAYFNGSNRDSSPGIRISMWRANWLLFLEQPLAGWGFAVPPPLKSIPAIAEFSTPLFEFWYLSYGGHNELLSSMMHTGSLGLLSRLLLLGVPLVVFAQAARQGGHQRRLTGFLGLALVLGYLVSSINTEVFNLIYIASFYGLLVAALGASALLEEAHEPV